MCGSTDEGGKWFGWVERKNCGKVLLNLLNLSAMKIHIAPSILSADFGKLNEDIASIEPHSDMLHVDVMDGHFVPNISFGQPVVKCLRTRLPLDLHLMIAQPEQYVPEFVVAARQAADLSGVENPDISITVHAEACQDLAAAVRQMKELKVKAAVSIKPGTPVSVLEPVLDELDMVLVMSVEPGFGGQKFMPVALEKIKELRARRSDMNIQVDGGINAETAKQCVEAGANILVAGSYVFAAEDRAAAIESLRPSPL